MQLRTAIVLIASMVATAEARPSAISGKYNSDRGQVTLVQDGARVLGAYRSRGEIDGELEGDTLRFTWRENGAIGRGMMLVQANGDMIGTWGSGADEQDGGVWRLTRYVAPPVLPVVPAAPVNHAGEWAIDLRFPWDVSMFSGHTGFGVGGFGVGLGVRATEHLYLGGAADIEMILVSGRATPGDIGPMDRLRAGVEARYYTTDTTAPSAFGGHQNWVGTRLGFETVDSNKTSGHFVEATIGRDSHLGVMMMGLYLSGGLSFEPAIAYGSTSATPGASATVVASASPMTTSPYFTFGMRLGF